MGFDEPSTKEIAANGMPKYRYEPALRILFLRFTSYPVNSSVYDSNVVRLFRAVTLTDNVDVPRLHKPSTLSLPCDKYHVTAFHNNAVIESPTPNHATQLFLIDVPFELTANDNFFC